MATQTLLIEGTFSELALELVDYIDGIKPGTNLSETLSQPIKEIESAQSAEDSSKSSSTQQTQRKVLQEICKHADVLLDTPEREATAAWNLLLKLCTDSPYSSELLNSLREDNEASEDNSAPNRNLKILYTQVTMFNVAPMDFPARRPLLLDILDTIAVSKANQAFEALLQQLESTIEFWVSAGQMSEEDVAVLYSKIAATAGTLNIPSTKYEWSMRAMSALQEDSAFTKSRGGLEILREGIMSAVADPDRYDYSILAESEVVQSVRDNFPLEFELLDMLYTEEYAAFKEFSQSRSADTTIFGKTWTSLPWDLLLKKIRILTLSGIASSAVNRTLPYSLIAEKLDIDPEDVEIWVIDSIRIGLIEGKLSQLKQEFLVQRATPRVFGMKQWTEIQSRLIIWRRSLESVLDIVRDEKQRFGSHQPAAYT